MIQAMYQKHRVAFLALIALLLVKFFAPLFLYDVPLGYDPGIYRYLFLTHANGLPPFILADIQPWATSHPLGLFILSSPFIKAGVPVDWFLGWIWNLVPALLLLSFSSISAKKWGSSVGVAVLIIGILSQPYYDGFSGMYWKAYASLAWMIFTFYLLEKKSPWAVITGVMTLVTHNQTGLLFALSVGLWWVLSVSKHWRSPKWQRATLGGLIVCAIAYIIYAPVIHVAIMPHLIPLLTLRGENVPAGSFPPALFYVRLQPLIFILGVYGFVQSLYKDRSLSLWHSAALISAIFVFAKLYFYNRFFLQLDFFLIPFAAVALSHFWTRYSAHTLRVGIVFIVLVQGFFSYRVMQLRQPEIDEETYDLVTHLHEVVPSGTSVIALENKSATWMVGWLPDNNVAGPGLFWLNWTYDHWEKLILGTDAERKVLLSKLRKPTYFVDTPMFREYYKEDIHGLLNDPCIARVEGTPLLEVICAKESL
ncbi:MAG: hypothetical protein O2904_00060 [bacterium]|nr:hypothetical protein [bacterium]